MTKAQQDAQQAMAARREREREMQQAIEDAIKAEHAAFDQRRVAEGQALQREVARRATLTPEQRAAEDDAINQQLRAKRHADHDAALQRKRERDERRELGELYPWETPGDVSW